MSKIVCTQSSVDTMLKKSPTPGFGVWLAARRLHQGQFAWGEPSSVRRPLSEEQIRALVTSLPWQRLGQAGVVTVL